MTMWTGRTVAGTIAALALAATVARADITAGGVDDPALGPGFAAQLSGEITARDVQALADARSLAEGTNVRMLMLNSPGGDVESALSIGRMVRALGITVIVPPGAECLSACVFILAAGVDRIPKGRVGIHRPYFLVPPGRDIGEALRRIEQDARDYLAEMNVPTRLAEDMFSIDPRDMEILDAERLRSYRLVGRDMVDREESALQLAEELGMTRQEYEAFAADINYRCTIFSGQRSALFDCIRTVAAEHGVPDASLLFGDGQ